MQKFFFKISSQKLILLCALYFGIILNMGFWRFVYEHISISNWSTGLFLLSLPAFLVIPLIIIFSLIIVPYIAKPALLILLCLSAAANYAMFKLGVFIDAEMYQNIVETNTREATDLITGSFLAWFGITAIIPALCLIRTRIIYSAFVRDIWHRLKQIIICILIIACFAPLTYKEYVAFGRNNREVRKLVNTLNYIYSVNKYYKLQSHAHRKFAIFDPQPISTAATSQKQLLLLIVGETARAQNFSLYGYKRQTNPELSRQDIITFADTSSCGTATAVSLPCMFSHQERAKFKVGDARHTQNLVDLLQSAGNYVFWRENDDGCKGICDRVDYEDTTQNNPSRYCFSDYCQDDAMLEGLEEKIAKLQRNSIIILHTMGSHGPTYYKRYPDSFKKFTPACETADIQDCTQEQIINTYDNTIVYTDHIISSVINILKRHPEFQSSLIYVSDHGESLGENGIYLHGLPYSIAPDEQTKIPFLLWLSDTKKRFGNIDESCIKIAAAKNKFSHDNLFHSVLGLTNTQTTAYKPELDIFAACRK